MHLFRNLKLADNAIGYTHAAGFGTGFPFTSKVVDSLFVGESENIGNPRTDVEKAYGRTLPKPDLPDFPIRGYEFYDRRHDVENVTFRNFEDNATRKTGALSYLMFTSFAVTSNNSVERAKFINAKPVLFPADGWQRQMGQRHGSSVAWKTAVIRDLDGSLTGVPDSYVLIDDGVIDSISVDAQVCERKPDWNATVCKGDVGRLSINGPGGPPPGPGQRPVGAPGAGGAVRAQPLLAQRRVLARRVLELVVAVAVARLPAARHPQPQRQAVRPDRHHRASRYGNQNSHRAARGVPQPDGTGSGLVGDFRAAGLHHRSLGVRNRTAWMRYAGPATPRTSRTRMRCGSRSSRPPTVAGAVAAVSWSVGKLSLLFERKPPASRSGAFSCFLPGSGAVILYRDSVSAFSPVILTRGTFIRLLTSFRHST